MSDTIYFVSLYCMEYLIQIATKRVFALMNDVLKPWQCAFDAQPKKKKEQNGGNISKTARH